MQLVGCFARLQLVAHIDEVNCKEFPQLPAPFATPKMQIVPHGKRRVRVISRRRPTIVAQSKSMHQICHWRRCARHAISC